MSLRITYGLAQYRYGDLDVINISQVRHPQIRDKLESLLSLSDELIVATTHYINTYYTFTTTPMCDRLTEASAGVNKYGINKHFMLGPIQLVINGILVMNLYASSNWLLGNSTKYAFSQDPRIPHSSGVDFLSLAYFALAKKTIRNAVNLFNKNKVTHKNYSKTYLIQPRPIRYTPLPLL